MRGPATILLCVLAVFALTGAEAALRVEPVAVIAEGLRAPAAVEVTADRIAVLEPFGDRLVVYTADGRLTAGFDLGGKAAGLAHLPDGDYALCDREGEGVLFVDPESGETRRSAAAGQLMDPLDLGFVHGALRVLDAGAAEIVTLDGDGQVASRMALVDGEGNPLVYPASLTAGDGEYFVLDQPVSRVHVYDLAGAHLRDFCSFGAGEAEVTRGGCLRADSRGRLFLADRFQGRVAVFDLEGAFYGHVDPGQAAEDRLSVPLGIAVDAEGLLYVASAEAGRVNLFEVSLDAAGLPAAFAVGPTGDGLSPEDLDFTVEAFFAEPPSGPVQVGFRVWETAAPAAPVAEVDGVIASTEDPPAEPGATYRAVWRPEIEFRAGTEYLWSARLQVGLAAGAWSAPWSFSTASVPRVFRLEQNRPNPFPAATTLVFSVPEAGDARLAIFDLQGREIWTRALRGLSPGTHEEVWPGIDDRGRPAPPGVYFCRLTAGNRMETRKMVLSRRRP